MRTIFLTTACLLCALFAQAQESATLEAIEKANARIKSLESHFVQEQKNLAKNETVRSEGTLYLTDTDKMAMHYDAPSTDLLIINGTDFYMKRDKRDRLYNTGKNATMRRLSNTLLQCLHGTPAKLAGENASNIVVSKEGSAYVVTLTTEKKQPRGYAKIVLTYDLHTKLLMKMQMDEFNGNSTTYEISDIKTNGTVAASVYDIPKK